MYQEAPAFTMAQIGVESPCRGTRRSRGAVAYYPPYALLSPATEREQERKRVYGPGRRNPYFVYYTGRAVQVDPMKPMLEPPATKRLKLNCDILLSTSAFKFNLRQYTPGFTAAAARTTSRTASTTTASTTTTSTAPAAPWPRCRGLFSTKPPPARSRRPRQGGAGSRVTQCSPQVDPH